RLRALDSDALPGLVGVGVGVRPAGAEAAAPREGAAAQAPGGDTGAPRGRATGSATGSPAPFAPASDSSIRCTSRAPADSDASSTARRSTSVTPEGAHMISRGGGG